MTRERLCLFGGTFDPPHVGHMAIAQVALEQWAADRVLFVPTGQSPHKAPDEVTQSGARLGMVERAVQGYPQFFASSVELDRAGPSYTIDTILTLTCMYPDATFGFLLGADMLADFPHWERANEIARRVELVAAPRPDQELQAVCHAVQVRLPSAIIRPLDMPALDISSRWLRSRLVRGLRSDMMLPTGVADYIVEKELYRSL